MIDGEAGEVRRRISLAACCVGLGLTYTDFTYTPAIAPSGRIGFAATTSGGTGVFAGLPGSVQSVAVTGQATDPTDPFGFFTFESFPGALNMNATGRTAFPALTTL